MKFCTRLSVVLSALLMALGTVIRLVQKVQPIDAWLNELITSYLKWIDFILYRTWNKSNKITT